MPLNVKPVRLRDSLYLLIPVDIARLVGIVAASSFSLTLNEDPESVKLVYEVRKNRQPEMAEESPKD